MVNGLILSSGGKGDGVWRDWGLDNWDKQTAFTAFQPAFVALILGVFYWQVAAFPIDVSQLPSCKHQFWQPLAVFLPVFEPLTLLTHCFIPQWHLSHHSSGFSAINCRCFQPKHDLLLTITEHFLGLNLIMPSPRHCFVKFPTYPFQIMYKCNVSVVCSNVKCQHLIWQLV